MVERAENDYYPTPDALAVAICHRIKALLPGYYHEIVEPSAGSGAFVRPMAELWSTRPIRAVDIAPNKKKLIEAGADTVDRQDWVEWVSEDGTCGPTLVIGNPPFSLATEHISAGLDCLIPGSHICFLLKLNFFGGKEREEIFWRQGQLKYFIPITGRPSFIKGAKSSTDTNEYGVFIWEVGWTGKAVIELPHILWK